MPRPCEFASVTPPLAQRRRPAVRRRSRRTGFTLIELLVVIAIIIALLAMLLPSMGKALAGSRRVMCLSNLRQTAVAFGIYHQDNFGTLYRPPTSDPHHSYFFWGGITMDWDYAYLGGTGYNKNTKPFVRGVSRYIDPYSDVFICPDDPVGDTVLWPPFGVDPKLNHTQAYYSTGGRSYMFNAYTVKTGIASVSMVQAPGRTMLVYDHPAFDVTWNAMRPPSWTSLPRWSFHDNDGAGTLPFADVRNGNAVSFFDGHAAYTMIEQAQLNTADYLSVNP